jgi:hypothetical protein
MSNPVLRSVSATCALLIAAVSSSVASAQVADPVVFSFATVGDSRTDPNKPDATTLLANGSPTTTGGSPSLTGTILPQDNEWVQNTLAFGTILSGIQSQNPNLLFFNGDMIFGYGRPTLPANWANGKPNSWTTSETVSPDAVFEYAQYAYWRGMVANLFLNGTYVIPVPGNHETQCSNTAAPYTSSAPNPNCAAGKTAYADNENMFRFNTGDLVQDLISNLRFSNVTGYFATNVTGVSSGSAAAGGNNGNITSNQSSLTYSFDIAPQKGMLVHFVVINTDPAGADGTAPADWLAADLASAKTRGATKFFVFGHKPAFTYNYSAASGGSVAPGSTNPGPGGLDATLNSQNVPVNRNAFWSVISQYNATYFSGHEHTVNVAQYADPTGVNSAKPYQVIVGSGGSPFDDKLGSGNTEPKLTNPYDRYYAWALVSIHQSGKVSLQVSGFSDQFGPIQDLTIYDVASLQ